MAKRYQSFYKGTAAASPIFDEMAERLL